MNYITLIIIFLIILAFSAKMSSQETKPNSEKKPAIILYEDGTWQKVADNKNTKPQKTISEVWKEFQTAIQKGEKLEIMKFFKYPFNLEGDLIEIEPITFEYKSIRPICNLVGALSKSKFEDNVNIILDNDFKKGILNTKSDEYTEGKSERFGKTNYTFDVKIATKFNEYEEINRKKTIVKKDGYIIYRIYFIEDSGVFKIYVVYFDKQ